MQVGVCEAAEGGVTENDAVGDGSSVAAGRVGVCVGASVGLTVGVCVGAGVRVAVGCGAGVAEGIAGVFVIRVIPQPAHNNPNIKQTIAWVLLISVISYTS